jgi:hypothetical protein
MRVASIRRGTVASAIPQLYPFGWCALMRVSAIRCAMFDCVCQLLLACRRLAHSCCDYVFVARFRFCHADRVGEPSREARPAQNCQSRKNQVLTKRSSDSRSARRFTPLPLPARRCTREGRGTSMSLRWHEPISAPPHGLVPVAVLSSQQVRRVLVAQVVGPRRRV